MTDNEINIAIAEACGWKPDGPWANYWIKNGISVTTEALPDYLNDLNAIHEAILAMPHWWQDRFTMELTRHCGSHKLAVNASARQRAEVFLRTLRKWKE